MGQGNMAKSGFEALGTDKQVEISCLAAWFQGTYMESLQRNKKIHSEHLKSICIFLKCLGHQGAYVPLQSIIAWLGVYLDSVDDCHQDF